MAINRVGVLPYLYLDTTTKALARVCGEALDKSSLFLNRSEFIEAFIKSEHVDRLKEVSDLVGDVNVGETRLSINTDLSDGHEQMIATMHYRGSPGILVPKYVESSLNIATPAGAKVLAWAQERRRIGIVLGDALDALKELNQLCGNGRALTLMFPALSSIMVRSHPYSDAATRDNDPVVKMGRRIDLGKSVGALPRLPREVVDRIRMASATVQAIFLSEDASQPIAPPDTAVIITGTRYADGYAPIKYARSHIMFSDRNTQTFI